MITLTQAKNWLRVTRNNEDSLIQGLLNASILWADGVCKRTFPKNTYEVYFESLVDIYLPNAPISTITSLSYIAEGDSIYTVINSANYLLDNGKIEPTIQFINEYELPQLAKRIDAVKVTYSGGFQVLPENVNTAIMLKLNSLYDNRAEENKRFLTTAEYLLMPHRIYNVL